MGVYMGHVCHQSKGGMPLGVWQWINRESDSPLDKFAGVDACLGL